MRPFEEVAANTCSRRITRSLRDTIIQHRGHWTYFPWLANNSADGGKVPCWTGDGGKRST